MVGLGREEMLHSNIVGYRDNFQFCTSWRKRGNMPTGSEDMSHFEDIGVVGDNIKMDHQEVRCRDMDLTVLLHVRKEWLL